MIVPQVAGLDLGCGESRRLVYDPSSQVYSPMAVVSIICPDPIEMYWKMVFCGAIKPDSGPMTYSEDKETVYPKLQFDIN